MLTPDISTARKLPWSNQGYFIGDFLTADGKPLDGCPRNALKQT